MTVSVGFIGVGNIGNPMAANVLKAGFPMTVFDTHAPAMENLVHDGARRGASARAPGAMPGPCTVCSRRSRVAASAGAPSAH